MNPKFEVIFLEQAIEFVENLDNKTRMKIFYNIDKAKLTNDPKLFKKLKDEIWEFRTKYSGIQIRLFAFWDKSAKTETLVISTHGIIKKVNKVPRSDIEKAEKLRIDYFNHKKL
ncbi:type II toxin-antitoxin system RelE/ParE family toxin [Polaribacter litorisediminis]|uniref:type II toxin-antitoxin system RelE/ParE family toxin n=1 Tax=Polaribacter litorisediminis TaxID=1908341 RepID=UPI001CBA9D1E|nr:type II toxin-antitoxin system RelE/ParE family toxin [Polaribacter litorisediminis]UAM97085.1 type II toxin-antitoxin system RelE/ParE family toxin [Polaribacter litorisediminis]